MPIAGAAAFSMVADKMGTQVTSEPPTLKWLVPTFQGVDSGISLSGGPWAF